MRVCDNCREGDGAIKAVSLLVDAAGVIEDPMESLAAPVGDGDVQHIETLVREWCEVCLTAFKAGDWSTLAQRMPAVKVATGPKPRSPRARRVKPNPVEAGIGAGDGAGDGTRDEGGEPTSGWKAAAEHGAAVDDEGAGDDEAIDPRDAIDGSVLNDPETDGSA